jgi:formiminoglutamate deiminase
VLPSGLAADVAVRIDRHGLIVDVEPGVVASARVVRRHGLTMPGAANTHSHAFHRVLRHRSQTGRGSFWTWREQMYGVVAALDPDRYHRLARAVFAEMALAGYVTVGEFHYVHHRPDGSPYAQPNAMGEALSQAAADAGMRITLIDTVYLHGGLGADGYRPLEPVQRAFGDHSIERWLDRVGAVPDLAHRRVAGAAHSVRAVDPDSIAAVASWSAETGAPIHAHVSEQPAENQSCHALHGCTPVEVFDRAGALGRSFTAVHATHLTDRDVGLLGGSGSGVCVCPTTERDLGDGVGPARALADAGVPLSIGSDSHAVIDPFEEVRAIELDERLVRQERGVFAADELAIAMTAGHRLLGWDDAGAIAAGHRADLVTVTLASPRTAGAAPDALLEALVFGASAADVTHVTIDGVDIVEDGRHLTIDVASELASAIDEVRV